MLKKKQKPVQATKKADKPQQPEKQKSNDEPGDESENRRRMDKLKAKHAKLNQISHADVRFEEGDEVSTLSLKSAVKNSKKK